MVTQAEDGVFKPKVYSAAVEPGSVDEALKSSEWQALMNDEYLALMRNYTWYLTELPSDRKAIGCK